MSKQTVELLAFKESGKYYSHYEIETEFELMYEIFDQVKQSRKNKIIPEFHYVVTGKSPNGADLVNGYPGLVLLD